MQCGFSLTQIGEFAFIIAALGVSLNVTSSFLYPIVVAVSVITTFLTPYMIRLSGPAYGWVDRHLPVFWKHLLERYSVGVQPVNHQNNWKKVLGAVVTILLISPFLRAMIMKKNHSIEFKALWADSRFNHAPLISIVLLRIVLAVLFVVYIIKYLFQASAALMVGIAILVVLLMIFSRFLKKQSIGMERVFVQNLRSKEIKKTYLGESQPEYAGRLLDRDLHLSDFVVPADSLWGGKTLMELDFGKKYGVHVASIIRGAHRINIPGGGNRIFPNDKLQVIGTDEQLSVFSGQLEKVAEGYKDEDFENREMYLKQFVIARNSPFCGRTIRESGIRNKYHCLVVGIESADDSNLRQPEVSFELQKGDVVWVVGEEKNLNALFEASEVTAKAE